MILNIKGKVQQVGYRYSVIGHVETKKLPVVGYVRNLPDGSVEVLAEGDIESLKDLHRFCTQGPPGAQVREVSQELLPINRLSYSAFNFLE